MSIQSFLSSEVEMLRLMKNPHRIGSYHSMSDFLIQNGCEFTPKKLPRGVKRGEAKMCFKNAAELAIHHPKRFIYCEGQAAGIIPVAHAWVLDRDDRVVDPTWWGEDDGDDMPRLGTEYFGIAIDRDYLVNMMLETETYGVIDQWTYRWPILTDDPKLWRHPIMDKLQLRKAA